MVWSSDSQVSNAVYQFYALCGISCAKHLSKNNFRQTSCSISQMKRRVSGEHTICYSAMMSEWRWMYSTSCSCHRLQANILRHSSNSSLRAKRSTEPCQSFVCSLGVYDMEYIQRMLYLWWLGLLEPARFGSRGPQSLEREHTCHAIETCTFEFLYSDSVSLRTSTCLSSLVHINDTSQRPRL